jgi:SPP1 gp7 family putative phage head morphogenesis protein
MAARRTNRREIVLPPIQPTKAQADSLALIYLRVVNGWRDNAEQIVTSYERTLAGMTTDAPNDTSATIETIAEALRRLVLTLTPDLRDWAYRVEDVHRGKWVRNILSAISIDLDTILSPTDVRDTVEAAIEWNVSLIRDVSEEVRRKVGNSVFTGFQQRKSARDVAKEIREATTLARQRALRIAADQTVKLGSRLNQARQEQAGLTHFKWRHSGKAHPRLRHKERDGKVYPWEGEGSIPADDRPGIPPFCGCVSQGVVVYGDE